MMRKVIYILAALVLLTGMQSCKKYLEVKPANILAISTYDDVKALLGAHLRMFTGVTSGKLSGTTIPFLNEDIYHFFELYSDDLDTDQFPKNPMAMNNRVLFSNSLSWKNPTMPGTIWTEHYSNIGFFNMIIDELDNVQATPAEKDIVKMEAKFLRAWYLFKALQYFSPYKNDRLGLPLNFDSQAVGSYDRKRKTQTEVYKVIISELKEILSCTTEPRSTYNIFFDKRLANALLAKVYHFKAGSGAAAQDDWDNAISYAKAAMGSSTILPKDRFAPFSAFDEDQYNIFKDREPALLTSVTYSKNMAMYNISNEYGLKQFATEMLYSTFTDNDVRKAYYFNAADKSITKFDKVTPSWTYYALVLNFFHISDLHLIIAESYARKGEMGVAKTWLESFQQQRYNGYTGYAGSDVIGEVLSERRKEFCYEYDMRWCELIRNPKGWTRKSYKDPNEATYTLNDNDFRFCLPIPEKEELQFNNIEPNPGWN